MPNDEVSKPASSEPSKSESQESSSGFLKWLGENYKKLGAAVALVVIGWNASYYWQGSLEKIKSEMDAKRQSDKREVEELKLEIARLRKYLVHNQEIELDQFNWACIERKAILDLNNKTCTYLDRQVVRRFEYLDPSEPEVMSKQLHLGVP
jgi:uncharacterized protein HemX